jgi:hypothetical protein
MRINVADPNRIQSVPVDVVQDSINAGRNCQRQILQGFDYGIALPEVS